MMANIRSLERLRSDLERELAEIASTEETDVYSYRLLPETARRVSLNDVARAWRRFQGAFSGIYDALKNGPKQRARLGKDEAEASSLGFAYTFTGSIGVVLTLPNERLLVGDTFLSMATSEMFKLAKATDSVEVRQFAKKLGPAPINLMYRWAETHVDAGIGASIEWLQGGAVRDRVSVQFKEMRHLQLTIGSMSESAEETESVTGIEGTFREPPRDPLTILRSV